MSVNKILITSALPYANGPLHFGHIAGAYLPGDCYARYMRMQGHEVLYLCGSDEHGVAITLSAEQAGRTPQAHVDLFDRINRELFAKLNFSFDHFSRTTWKGHAATTCAFFEVLNRKGYIEERTEKHLYSEKEQRFLADRYVTGTCPKCGHLEARGDECPKCGAAYEATDLKNPRSKVTGSPLVLKPSAHLYFRFDKFGGELSKWLQSKHWKENVLKFAQSYVDDLKPRAITRDSDWGIPVPGYPDKVFYVWFDAPIGYISAAQEWAQSIGKPTRWEDFWLDPKTRLVQFIGKDNIPFHAVFFPAMLMGQDLPYKLPDEIPANEFFLLEGRQFSKSDNWTIDLERFFTRYTADQIRYAIAANAPETADSEFTWRDFQLRCNSELLGKLGNFINRLMVFNQNKLTGTIPAGADREFLADIHALADGASQAYETFHLRKATQLLMEIAQKGNVYFDTQKPWALLKDPASHNRLHEVIASCFECAKTLALVASPILPTTAQAIWHMLGQGGTLSALNWPSVLKTPLPAGQKLREPVLLFKRVEDGEIEEELAILKGQSTKA